MKTLIKALLVLLFIQSAVTVKAQTTVYPKEFTVAQDGSGHFKTIQEAVNAVRDLSQQRVTIHIKKGVYHEKVVVPSWKSNIYLLGEDKENTIITNSDFSGKPVPGGRDAYGKDKYSTYTSYTLLVQGNDFKAENLSIINAAGRVGQAVALHVEADRSAFVNCSFSGNQDTLFTATENSRQYYKDCLIEGTTDFIFGPSTAVFEGCTIKSLTNSFVTAASTTPRQKFGYVFLRCKLVADSAAAKVYLGRPWRPNAKTVFIECEMGKHILAEGWHNWGNADNEKTVLYAEYKSQGPGGAADKRLKWGKQLTDREAKNYTVKNILGGVDNWVPGS